MGNETHQWVSFFLSLTAAVSAPVDSAGRLAEDLGERSSLRICFQVPGACGADHRPLHLSRHDGVLQLFTCVILTSRRTSSKFAGRPTQCRTLNVSYPFRESWITSRQELLVLLHASGSDVKGSTQDCLLVFFMFSMFFSIVLCLCCFLCLS